MAKSNVFMNYTGFTAISPVPTTYTLTGVMNVQEIVSEGMIPFQADGHVFVSLLGRATADRAFTVTCADIAAMRTIPRNTPLTISYTVGDARNVAGTGAYVVTWTNAYVVENPASGASNQFAGGTISFVCIAPDGVTDPYSAVQTT